jgi:hypothetical protein
MRRHDWRRIVLFRPRSAVKRGGPIARFDLGQVRRETSFQSVTGANPARISTPAGYRSGYHQAPIGLRPLPEHSSPSSNVSSEMASIQQLKKRGALKYGPG